MRAAGSVVHPVLAGPQGDPRREGAERRGVGPAAARAIRADPAGGVRTRPRGLTAATESGPVRSPPAVVALEAPESRMKKALICGITGQDGSYLAELLLSKRYEVHGMIRRASTFNTHRIEHLYHDPHEEGPQLTLHYGDLTDGSQLARLIRKVEPDEIYNLAAQSHV